MLYYPVVMQGIPLEKTIGFTRDYEDLGSISSRWIHLLSLIKSAYADLSLPEDMLSLTIPHDIEVYTDFIFKKVFTTLFENSVRHGGTITKISVFVQESENGLIIVYTDDGTGIMSEEKKQVSRRDFLKIAGLAAVAVQAGGLVGGGYGAGSDKKGNQKENQLPVRRYLDRQHLRYQKTDGKNGGRQ